MLKDIPLQLQYSNFKKMSIKDKLNIQEEIFKKLNDVHGPVVDTYGEILESEDKIIIHNIVEIQSKSSLNIEDNCSGRCGNKCGNC